MKKGFLTATILSFLLAFSAGIFAFTIKTTANGRLLQWSPSRLAIFYRVAQAGVGKLPESIEAIDQAFTEWEIKSKGELEFVYAGQSEEEECIEDGINSILWVDTGWKYGNKIAAVSTIRPSNKEGTINEVDIEFNARDFDWSSFSSPGIRETALHEIGHLLGVGHSFNPGAVMHATAGPASKARQALSQDDVEALMFLYPPQTKQLNRYDLPVLFYPRDFPGEESELPPVTGPDVSLGGWIKTAGGMDFDGDGFRSELLVGGRRGDDWKILEVWELIENSGDNYQRIESPWSIQLTGDIKAISGIDINRDSIGSEVAILLRQGDREKLFFYDPVSSTSMEPAGSLVLSSPPADNLIGMADLDADGDLFKDELLILRAEEDGFILYLHKIPFPGEYIEEPDVGIEVTIPGLHENSSLLGLAVLDADGDGREGDPVFLELTTEGEYWLHAFHLTAQDEIQGYRIEYLSSAQIPTSISGVLPSRMAGLDINQDGYFNELIIFSSEDDQ